MSALEVVNGQQFMGVKRMGRLMAGDFEGHRMAEVGRMRHMSPSPGMTQRGETQRDLIKDVAANGVQEPLYLRNSGGVAEVHNGHHRYNAAVQSGQTRVPIEFGHWNTKRDAANTAGHYTMPANVKQPRR